MNRKKTNNNRVLNQWLPFIICVVLATLFLVITRFIPQEMKTDTVEFSAIDKICELATMRCYFHNVGEWQVDPDGIFRHGLFKYGYKKLWIEYTGSAKIGIDANKVIIENPDENGVVRIFVPEAKVLDVDVVMNSEDDLVPIMDTGAFTTITTEEQSKLLAEEQKNMEEKISQDVSTLNQARKKAKLIMESYVKNIGNMLGQTYTVEWMESIGTNISTVATAE